MERVVRASTPETIEADLEALWREVADRAPVTRAMMSNLVVFRNCPQAAEVDLDACVEEVPVDEVVRRHPSRLIVLVHQDDPHRLQAPVAASISIRVFGSGEARHAIEQITVRSVCAEASLPSIVRRLVLGDLPTAVWWTEDLSQSPPPAALVTMGRQFVYDSRQWRDARAGLSAIAALVGRPHTPDLADINWRRLAPMRQALQRRLSVLAPGMGGTSIRVHVRHHRLDAAKAWLLVGWLASELGSRAQDSVVTTVDESDIAAQPLSVTIESGEGLALSAEMDDAQVVVRDASADAPFAVKVPSESVGEAIAAELRELGRDATLVAAIHAANARLGSAA
jgi:glucose-6-phosphate dehydrogenase assembly protein OpcA